jgi:hypothetical protein
MVWIPPHPKGNGGANYCIVRVARDEKYWEERLAPGLRAFSEELAAMRSGQHTPEVVIPVAVC